VIGKYIDYLKNCWLWLKRKTVWRRFEFGPNFHSGRAVVLWAPHELKIGKDVYIGRHSQIECDAVIGDYVIMANHVSFVGRYDHNYRQIGVPIRRAEQMRNPDYSWKGKGLKVEVGDDVWIGLGVVILSGVKIGKGSIIAAGAVVTKDVEPNSIYAGCPAKKMTDRFENSEQCQEHWDILYKGSLGYRCDRKGNRKQSHKGPVDILMVGQKPPPYHGQAVVTGLLFDHDWPGMNIKHLYMEYSGSIKDVGKQSVTKVFHMMGLIIKTWMICITRRPKVLYYLPASPRKIPIIRDIIYLKMTRWLFPGTIFHYHAGGLGEFLDNESWLAKLGRKAYDDAVVSVELCDIGVSPGTLFNARRTTIVPNGLDVGVMPRTRPDDAVFHILFMGAVREGKGVLELIETARIIKSRGYDCEFQVVGSWYPTQFESEVRKKLDEYGLKDNFEFSGSLNGDDKWHAYANADAFCLPSHYESENFPLVLIEAMALKLPIVTTKWRGIPQLVSDTAILCDIKSPGQYADAIISYIDDESLRSEKKQLAHDRYQSFYTHGHFIKRMEDVFAISLEETKS